MRRGALLVACQSTRLASCTSYLTAARFIQLPTVSACPYSHPTPTVGGCPFEHATPVATPMVEHCPVVGDAPPMHCPVESEPTLRKPTLYQMACIMGKTQLSAYVAATALAGYVIGGGAVPLVAAIVTGGTMLQSCSANTANQIIEVEYDKLMKRTCRRPLPMNQISKRGAIALSAGELAAGSALLCTVSPAAAALGLVNWFLYVVMYTSLKRRSATNTWFGSIVGGLPPLMGGLAVAGQLTGPVVLLGTFLFVWQIPHFHGLAFHCRRDYQAAGYKMLAYSHPWRASFYSVLMSLVMAGLTLAGPSMCGIPIEGIWYYPVSVAANAVMIYKALLFHNEPKRHCRGCFVFSYVYLSIMLAALMLNYFQPVHHANALIQRFTGEAQVIEEEETVADQMSA